MLISDCNMAAANTVVYSALCRLDLIVAANFPNIWLFKIISGELGAAVAGGLVPASKVRSAAHTITLQDN